jgi:hypothetical protein
MYVELHVRKLQLQEASTRENCAQVCTTSIGPVACALAEMGKQRVMRTSM